MSLVLPLPLPPRSPRHYPKSRGSTPGSTTPTSPSPARLSSRPSTPPPQLTISNGIGGLSSFSPLPQSQQSQPLSAPSTPVTATHHFPGDVGCKGMERCRSSEAVMSHQLNNLTAGTHAHVPSPLHSETGVVAAGGHLEMTPRNESRDRGGRGRAPKATSLLFHTVPSKEQIAEMESKAEWAHVETAEVQASSRIPRHMPALGSPIGSQTGTDSAEGSPTAKTVEVDDHGDERMDVDEPELPAVEVILQSGPPEPGVNVWGMPRWGWEEERKEVRKGVRLVGMEELPGLIDQHAMLDVPSCVMFPWLHGISDDGQKGRDMAAFFGRGPPFEPPPYRGLSVMLCPAHAEFDHRSPPRKVKAEPARRASGNNEEAQIPKPIDLKPLSGRERERERSETMSTSSDSYVSSRTGTTEGTSPSVADFDPHKLHTTAPLKISEETDTGLAGDETPSDVQMHPCESKRVTVQAVSAGLANARHPLPCDPPTSTQEPERHSAAESSSGSSSTDDSDSDDELDEFGSPRPTSLLLNALHVQDVFYLPCVDGPGQGTHSGHTDHSDPEPHFKAARLPNQINLRNLNIQQIKYATISDIVLYAKYGVGAGVLEVAEEIAQAQERLWNERMKEFYSQVDRASDAVQEPVKYGVWVLVEPFSQIERFSPHLINLDSRGKTTANSPHTDLFEREAHESRLMTRGSEVVEGFWVGNDSDVPGESADGVGATVPFDVCVKASELADMPSSTIITWTHRKVYEMDKRRNQAAAAAEQELANPSWTASPATIALRNLLSPPAAGAATGASQTSAAGGTTAGSGETTGSKRTAAQARGSAHSPTGGDGDIDERQRHRMRLAAASKPREFVSLECAGSCRTIMGQMRPLSSMTDKVIDLVYFLRKLVEGRDKSGLKRQVLVHCQDGYTESSIIVLAYIMSSLSVSLPEAFLHLQNTAKRSFFLYPSDKPLLRKIDARLAADRRAKAIKLISSPPATAPSSPSSAQHQHQQQSPSSPSFTPSSSRWRAWGFGSLKSGGGGGGAPSGEAAAPASPSSAATAAAATEAKQQAQTTQAARDMLVEEEKGGSKAANDAKVWFDDRRFDGFPSRILLFLYLGNLEHAGNAAMLHAIGITHVVSVGESLLGCHPDSDPAYGHVNGNSLAKEYTEGRMSVLDLCDIRDDGNDPLRPLIARAVQWIEDARASGGTVLVHCRVGVSRSASIVIAYMMAYQRLGLMDAYLLTRARRLNVLIQPNLRFFHELFGWEVELARREEEEEATIRTSGTCARVAGENYTATSCTIQGKIGPRRIMYSWPAFCRDLHCLNRRFLCN